MTMGSQTSKLLKKGMDYMTGSTSAVVQPSSGALAKFEGTPFVWTRTRYVARRLIL